MNIKQLLDERGFGEVQDTYLLHEDLGFDSLESAWFSAEYDIPDEAWSSLKTVGDLQSWVDNHK